jgi:hypothetical protein
VTSLAGPLIRNGRFVSLNPATGLAPSDIRSMVRLANLAGSYSTTSPIASKWISLSPFGFWTATILDSSP